MSSGARVVSAYVKQVTQDVIPSSGWKVLPNISNGLNNSTTLTDSEMLNGTRVKAQGMVTSGEISGDLSAELLFGTYDEFFEAAFWNDWTVAGVAPLDPSQLTIGDKRKMFAVSKDFEDIKAFYAFKGVHVNTMNIEVATDGIIKVTFGLMGLGYETQKTVTFATGATPAVVGDKVSGMSIGDIKYNGAPIGVCVEAFSFELDNQSEIQKCLGSNLYGGNIHAMIANASGSMTIAFSEKAYDILELQRTGGTMSIEVPITFADGSGYIIKIPKSQIQGDIPSPSGNELVTAEVTYMAVDESPILVRIAKPIP